MPPYALEITQYSKTAEYERPGSGFGNLKHIKAQSAAIEGNVVDNSIGVQVAPVNQRKEITGDICVVKQIVRVQSLHIKTSTEVEENFRAEGEVAPGTLFDKLPDEWTCPVCGEEKDMYIKA